MCYIKGVFVKIKYVKYGSNLKGDARYVFHVTFSFNAI